MRMRKVPLHFPKAGRGERLVRTGCAAAIAVYVSSCATVPELPAPAELRTADTLEYQRSLSAPAVALPETQWWAVYGDAQLNALIERALSKSPTMASAMARVRSADALLEQAGSSLYPGVTLNAQGIDQRTSGNLGRIEEGPRAQNFRWNPKATLDFTYEFDFWGSSFIS